MAQPCSVIVGCHSKLIYMFWKILNKGNARDILPKCCTKFSYTHMLRVVDYRWFSFSFSFLYFLVHNSHFPSHILLCGYKWGHIKEDNPYSLVLDPSADTASRIHHRKPGSPGRWLMWVLNTVLPSSLTPPILFLPWEQHLPLPF